MKKIKIDIDQQKLTKESKLLSTVLKHYAIKYGDMEIEKIKLLTKPLCILPYDSDESKFKIDNIYVAKQYEFLTNSIETNSILVDYDNERHDSPIDAIFEFINEYFNIPTDKVSLDNLKLLDKIYYVGVLQHSHYLHADIPCYAVDIRGFSKNIQFPVPVNELNYIAPMKYKDLVNGGSHDSLVAAAVFMLIAYFT